MSDAYIDNLEALLHHCRIVKRGHDMVLDLLPGLVHMHLVRLVMCLVLCAECLRIVAMTDAAKMVEQVDERRSRAVDD